MSVVTLSCRMRFSASHRLLNEELSEEENWRLFGKCYHANGHGHNYDFYILLKAPIDSKTGMIMNVNEIESIVDEHVMKKVDHKHLNMDVPEFRTLNPTVENIAVVIWRWLKPHFGNALDEVRVHETEDYSAIYRGE